MSIQHYIKCEMCDNKHEIVFLYKAAVWRELPSDWLTLFSGDANPDGWHFCSDKCLVQWTTGNIEQEQSNKPSCKMRRFVLSEKSGACQTEGVLWASNHIDLDPTSPHCGIDASSGDFRHCNGVFCDWNTFVRKHSDYEITWIDEGRV